MDSRSVRRANSAIRVAGILLALTTLWYVPWLIRNLNWDAPWLSIPFAAATLMTAAMTTVTVINHWQYAVPDDEEVRRGQEPNVAVIIPTYGEPEAMVYETAKSVLQQDYPPQRLTVVISDDGHRRAVQSIVHLLQRNHEAAAIYYHEPPRKGDPARKGDAKAGNLNAALAMLDQAAPHIRFIETRDADDKVGDPAFLRQVIGQLLAHPDVAYVQTIKEADVSSGDPFGNLEPLFYRKAMLAKNAANAVFPCGSGLVWRREALKDIDGFPTWNLVEDLQSGVEALRRGWRGLYLPIVGALGQTAPEDIPNVKKQRGTWAIDTMRLTFWGDKSGLNLRQHLQFAELGFFYLLSFAVLVFVATPILSLLFDVYPLITTHRAYALRFWPYAAGVELLLASLAYGLPYEDLWRARQIWLGIAPVYARATIIALIYGPDRLPSYRVTRKEHVYGWYWREILLQLVLFFGLVGSSLHHIATHSLLYEADLGSLYWAAFFAVTLSRIVRNSWYGLEIRPLATLRSMSRRDSHQGAESSD